MSEARSIEAPVTSADQPPAETVHFARRRTLQYVLRRVLFLGVIPAAAVAAALWLYLGAGRFVSTENAYVKSHIVNVSPEVAGNIVRVAVEENERVEAGALLFTLDDVPYRLALDGATARLAEVETEIASDKREYQSALAEIALHESSVEYAQSQLARQQTLVDRNLGRDEDLDTARYELVSAERRVTIAQQHAETLLAKLNGDPDVPPADHPAWRSARMQVEKAELDLARTSVHAPFAGTIAKRPEPGAYAFPFMPVIAIVAEDDMWIEANFKETQMTHMLPGQSVDVTVDAYPGEHWEGRVESISRSTGAQFAMLPPQNATGNWVKIVQRVPIRVRVNEAHPTLVLRAGMSCEVTVDTGYQRHLRDLIADW
jgi:membrane fusion protein (multidrug efflux system)